MTAEDRRELIECYHQTVASGDMKAAAGIAIAISVSHAADAAAALSVDDALGFRLHADASLAWGDVAKKTMEA